MGFALTLCIVALLGVSYLATAGLFWVVCWALRVAWWSWRSSLAVWVLLLMIGGGTRPRHVDK